jgi:H+/gluconate symporter-like permease
MARALPPTPPPVAAIGRDRADVEALVAAACATTAIAMRRRL